MPGDPHKAVRTGDPLVIPAGVWNDILRLLEKAGRPVKATGNVAAFNGYHGVVNVSNDSGAAVKRFEILRVDNVKFTPSDNLVNFQTGFILSGKTPGTDCQGKGNFLVMQEDVAAGVIGKGMLIGVTPVKVDIVDADHRCCDVQASNKEALKSCPFGAGRIVWPASEASLSVQWCLVAIGFPHEAAPPGCDDPECPTRISDATKIPDWDDSEGALQTLVNVGGCLRWVTGDTECPPSEGG